MGVSKREYREWLETLEKPQLVALVIETREIADFARRQFEDAIENAQIPFLIEAQMTSSERARASARKRLDGDPKQAAKWEAYKLWLNWQSGQTLHKSGAAFARFVCDKWPVIESPTTVERWARKWAAERAKR